MPLVLTSRRASSRWESFCSLDLVQLKERLTKTILHAESGTAEKQIALNNDQLMLWSFAKHRLKISVKSTTVAYTTEWTSTLVSC